MGRKVRQGLVKGRKGRRGIWPRLPYSADEIVKAVVTPVRPMKSEK